jgi:MFS family permease
MNTVKPHRPFYNFGKWTLYLGVAVCFITGVLWLMLDNYFEKEGDFGPIKHPWQFNVLKIHGAVAMAMMMLFGGVLATHVRHYWRKNRSRKSGLLLVLSFVILIVSAYLLFYASEDIWRSSAQWLHIVFGIGLPLTLTIHVIQRKS